MDKLLAVIKREFLERVRTRWFLVATLLGPGLFAVITLLPAWLAVSGRGSTTIANEPKWKARASAGMRSSAVSGTTRSAPPSP